MAITGTNYLIPVQFHAHGSLAAADDLDQKTFDFPCLIYRVSANLGTTGDTSGNTDFVLEKNGATDLWTVAADAGRFAYNASALYLEWDWENDAWTGYASGQTYFPSGCRIAKGDYLRLNVDAIPGGTTSTDLVVTVWVKPLVD